MDDLFSPKLVSSLMNHASEEIQAYLLACQRQPDRVLPWQEPIQALQSIRETFDQSTHAETLAEKFRTITKAYLEASNHLHSPHSLGHQVAPPLAIPAVFEAVSAFSNQGMAVYEMGPFSSAAERFLVGELGKYLGWSGTDFDGIVTHGGSLANFTALLAARNARYPDSWSQGIPSDRRPAILTSAESHYSNARAAGMMGIGVDSVIAVPVNAKRSMDTSQLPGILDKAKKEGRDVFCIMASSCSTPIGAFDDLQEIGRLAKERGLWLHVDGAHGASLLLSEKYRERLRGIELADSVAWDTHKMMYTQSLCTFLFYRKKSDSYLPFQQKAPYLFASGEAADYDSALRTVECTKGAAIMPFFATWCTLGPQFLERIIDRVNEQTMGFYTMLKASSDFEILHEPECNILCFRYLPEKMKGKDPAVISAFQKALRKRIIESGEFYITATVLDGRSVLRVTVMNPLTDQTHFERLMNTIRKTGGSRLILRRSNR